LKARFSIGVLALQGAVREHINMLKVLGVNAIPVKWPGDLVKLDALIIPGGESTTIGKLMTKYGLVQPIQELGQAGMPIYGTCAGLILLAKKVVEGDQPLLGLMDIEVRRNAFGRQRESFEADLKISEIDGSPFRGVFIRAPWIESADRGVKILATLGSTKVMARQNNFLVTAFHPELTDDNRIHRYFLNMIRN
jgi:5'-phosphate synthase pdxT subunit